MSNERSGADQALRTLLVEYRQKVAALELLLGETARQVTRGKDVLAQALRLDRRRRGPHPTPEERERRREVVGQIVGRTPLPLCTSSHIVKELARQGLSLSVSSLTKQMNEWPEIERVGQMQFSRYRLRKVPAAKPAPSTPKKKKLSMSREAIRSRVKRAKRQAKEVGGVRIEQSQSFNGTTDEKARTLVALVRDAEGGLIALKDLVPRARAAGIASLTGIVNYTRAGWLRRTRDHKGHNAYRFIRMPPEPEASMPATVDTIE